jgi:[DsrC]-trisulfide reductase subunit J
MRQCPPARRAFASLLSLLLLLPLATTAAADEGGEKEFLPFSDLSFPETERHFSATEKCVQPVEEMRKNHMNYILHQRDETVHEGIRTRRYSLEECVNCHAARNAAGDYIPVNDPDQFCFSCHNYAAVNIDCFQCHATRPVRPSTLQTLSSGGVPASNGKRGDKKLERLASEGHAK